MKKTRGLLTPAAALAALALTIPCGCGKKEAPPQMPPPRVTAARAEQKTPALVYETFGTLVSPASVELTAQVTGKIAEVNFREGDPVKAGDVLFTIETDVYQAELDSAAAQLDKAEAQLALDRITLDRNRGLLAKKLISQQDFDTLTAQLKASQAERDLARAQLAQARINLGYCTIISPIAGRTGKRLVDPGNIVIADQGPNLVSIRQLDPLYIDFTVSETYFARLQDALGKGNLKISLTPAGDDKKYEGEVSFLDNAIDPATGSFAMRGTIKNADGRLWPGQYVTVGVQYGQVPSAVIVPLAAVQVGQKGPYIFTLEKDQTVKLHNPVKLGPSIPDGAIVEEGIKAGESVVTSGQLGLRDGAKVQVITDEDKKAAASATPGEGSK